ncbi:aminoacyl tRNA synthase complex-interacting multifunctional protein 1-like [Glandiceps talaboti]
MLLVRPIFRMAAADTLKRLEQRAKQADETISYLKQQVDVLKKHAVSALANEEIQLEAENNQLKKEIESMKKRLVYIETQNGFKQMSLPNAKMTATITNGPAAPAATEAASKPVNAATADDATDAAKKKEPKPAKKKKEGKPAKQQEKQPEVPVDVSFLDLRIGYIKDIKKHPDADTLYIEEIDCGEEQPRTVVSGLVRHYKMSEMKDKLVIVCCNLKPAKMRGVLSQAMVMCGSSPEKVELLDPPEGSVIGDRISFEGYKSGTGDFPAQMNPKKKIWERIQPDLLLNGDGIATYKGVPFKVEGKGVCTAPSMKNSGIK